MNNTELNFKHWIAAEMMGSTGVVFDPKQKSRDWNWQGAPGKLSGVSPKEDPIGCKPRKKK